MSDKETDTLFGMVMEGKEYREDYDFEYMGTEVTAVLRALPDKEFLPIAGKLQEKFDMDEEDAVEEIEDAKEEDGGVDVSDMDKEFVDLVQTAAKMALDHENMDGPDSQEDVDMMVESMVGGYSVELGGKALELAGTMRDAEKFRGDGFR